MLDETKINFSQKKLVGKQHTGIIKNGMKKMMGLFYFNMLKRYGWIQYHQYHHQQQLI